MLFNGELNCAAGVPMRILKWKFHQARISPDIEAFSLFYSNACGNNGTPSDCTSEPVTLTVIPQRNYVIKSEPFNTELLVFQGGNLTGFKAKRKILLEISTSYKELSWHFWSGKWRRFLYLGFIVLLWCPFLTGLWVCFGKLQWSAMEMIQESMRQSMWVAYNISKYQSLGFTINYSSVVSALGGGGKCDLFPLCK